jgi:hypothetical protein
MKSLKITKGQGQYLVAACSKNPLVLFSTKSSIISLGLVCQDVFGTHDVVDEVEMVCKIVFWSSLDTTLCDKVSETCFSGYSGFLH